MCLLSVCIILNMFLHIIVFHNCLCFVSCVHCLHVIKVKIFFTVVNKTEKKTELGGEDFLAGGTKS